MKLSRVSKNGLRVFALALVLGFVVSAYADGPECLSNLGTDKKSKAAAAKLLAQIEKVAQGSLLDHPWSNANATTPNPKGDTVFKFTTGDGGALLAEVDHLDTDSMDQMIIAAGYVPQALADTPLAGPAALSKFRDALQGMLDNGAVQFEASICPPAGATDFNGATAFTVDLKGIDDTGTAGYLGNINVSALPSGKGAHLDGKFVKGTDKPSAIVGDFGQADASK